MFVAIALVSLEAPIPLHSQTAGISHISGVVTDQTGAAIAGAEVVFTNGTFSARQVTDDQGEFVLSPISTDFGVVRVSAQGFQIRSMDWHAGANGIHIVLLPSSAAEEITTPGPGQIHALFVSSGNPVLSVPNGPELEDAMQELDLMVAIEETGNSRIHGAKEPRNLVRHLLGCVFSKPFFQ